MLEEVETIPRFRTATMSRIGAVASAVLQIRYFPWVVLLLACAAPAEQPSPALGSSDSYLFATGAIGKVLRATLNSDGQLVSNIPIQLDLNITSIVCLEAGTFVLTRSGADSTSRDNGIYSVDLLTGQAEPLILAGEVGWFGSNIVGAADLIYVSSSDGILEVSTKTGAYRVISDITVPSVNSIVELVEGAVAVYQEHGSIALVEIGSGRVDLLELDIRSDSPVTPFVIAGSADGVLFVLDADGIRPIPASKKTDSMAGQILGDANIHGGSHFGESSTGIWMVKNREYPAFESIFENIETGTMIRLKKANVFDWCEQKTPFGFVAGGHTDAKSDDSDDPGS